MKLEYVINEDAFYLHIEDARYKVAYVELQYLVDVAYMHGIERSEENRSKLVKKLSLGGI